MRQGHKRSRIVYAAVGLLTVTLVLASCGGDSPTAPPAGAATPAPASPTAAAAPTANATMATAAAPTTTTPTQQQARMLRWDLLKVEGAVPPPRKDATLVHDEAGNRLLLFGGRRGGVGLNDLWAFDVRSARWSEITAVGAPPPRWGHVSVYDVKRRQIVVFSGQSQTGFFNDTWTFNVDSGQWRQANTSGGLPATRYGSCAAYDAAADRMYISHGFTNSGRFDDTWALDLAALSWTDVSPGTGRPIPRCLHRCSLDPEGKGFLLYGGQSNSIPFLGDLWRYDPAAKSWQQLPAEQGAPAERFFSSFDRDPRSGKFLVYGGVTRTGVDGDLWSYSRGKGWVKEAPTGGVPRPRSNHAAAVDPATGALFIFGGSANEEVNELWRLAPA